MKILLYGLVGGIVLLGISLLANFASMFFIFPLIYVLPISPTVLAWTIPYSLPVLGKYPVYGYQPVFTLHFVIGFVIGLIYGIIKNKSKTVV